MPIIREEVFHFVRVWNRHQIRRQSNRPLLPTGRPYILYNYPQYDTTGNLVQNYGQIPNASILQELSKNVAEYSTYINPIYFL